ncbi:EndoS/ChiA family endoglycosidase [Streptococcus ictaluri]|uniref:mannosyl-glycoprotein endo-beta-N-acetylglucosaminidase n=1 Tax=Streptococcus ictaluri 707-05 TaxID=764299 RepID=G5K5Q9_9STRE|nr:hypothetical protein [Streptococcus ictaluri]EHI68690.1 hypothetical protein STRIC_0396 [Streptococcus ictaluri 707-05]
MDKRQFTKCAVGLVCAAVLAGAAMQTGEGLGLQGFQPAIVRAQEKSPRATTSEGIVNEIRQGTRGQLYGAYFRTWHDIAATKAAKAVTDDTTKVVDESQLNKPWDDRKNSMAEVPEEVDMLFVFDDWVHEESPFWDKLKNDYVLKMHEQGTAVIQTISVNELTGKAGLSAKPKYPDDEIGNARLARDLVDKYVYQRGVDGLDIDVEGHDYDVKYRYTTKEQVERAKAVFKEIAKLIGKAGKDSDKLLIMDTTLSVEQNPLFCETADSIDLLLRQYYGTQNRGSGDALQLIKDEWDGYRNYISPRQFMIGFSFYEERSHTNEDNIWYDINQYDESDPEKGSKIEGTQAEKYAKWQPDNGGLKGGIFSYAIDRDGVAHPKKWSGHRKLPNPNGEEISKVNEIYHTEYKVSKALKEVMKKAEGYKKLTEEDFPDKALLAEVQQQVGIYKGDLERFDKKLNLSNPDIKNLKGLTELKKVKHITLDGLTGLSELDVSMLPESIKEHGGLTLKGMTGLKTLNISGIGLESLESLDVESLSGLTTFDISNNKLDLKRQEKLLNTLLDTVKKHGTDTTAETIKFETQRPIGYFPTSYGPKEATLVKGSDKNDISKEFVLGTSTKAGTLIKDKNDFEIYKVEKAGGRPYIAQDWTYEAFTKGVSYKDFTVLQVNSTLGKNNDRIIKTDKDESFKIKVFKDKEMTKLVHEMEVKVGEGNDFLTNLSLEATAFEN